MSRNTERDWSDCGYTGKPKRGVALGARALVGYSTSRVTELATGPNHIFFLPTHTRTHTIYLENSEQSVIRNRR